MTAGNPRGTGIGDEEFVLAGVTPGAGEAVGEDAAVEIAVEGAISQRLLETAAATVTPIRRKRAAK